MSYVILTALGVVCGVFFAVLFMNQMFKQYTKVIEEVVLEQHKAVIEITDQTKALIKAITDKTGTPASEEEIKAYLEGESNT